MSRRQIQQHLLLLATATCALLLASLQNLSAESPATKSTTRPATAQRILEDDVRPHVEYLASPELRGRSGYGSILAAKYIRDHFEKCGLKPLFEGESYFQPIPGPAREDQKKYVMGRNIGGLIPGSDPELRNEYIIISAHYDHLGERGDKIFAGADDNASGVSMLLEVSERMANAAVAPRRSVVFVAFDLEEHMLWGSRWFAAHTPWPIEQVKFFLTADMIGRSLGNLSLPTVFVMGSEHATLVKAALDRAGEPEGLEVARLGIDLIGPVPRSDYGPFRERKVPFLFFSTGEHPDYHTPRDTPDRIEYNKVAGVSSLILDLTGDIANSDEAPVWTDDVTPDLEEVRALNRITTLLLQDNEEHPLNNFQRFVISGAQTKTNQIIERGDVTSFERTYLISVTQMLMLSVF